MAQMCFDDLCQEEGSKRFRGRKNEADKRKNVEKKSVEHAVGIDDALFKC